MIGIYPSQYSVLPGEVLGLHVSDPRPECEIEVQRLGAPDEVVATLAIQWPAGLELPVGVPTRDWGWPRHDVQIPADWRPGVYRVRVLGAQSPFRGSGPPEPSAIFVVRNPAPGQDATILYKLAVASYGAYNSTGYGSLYAEATWSRSEPQGFKVTLRRPGVGSGGLVAISDPPDPHSPGSRRQTIDHWDAPFIRWLEARGYAVDYCTDIDVHRDPAILKPYSLMLSIGHDEYWSGNMRQTVEEFIASGGNVAFLTGNTAWWRIDFVDDETAIVCTKLDPDAPITRTGGLAYAVDPPNRFAGVSTTDGGGWWDGRRDPQGYTVQHSGHWCYDGTGLSDGDVWGDTDQVPLIGYEVDGLRYRLRNGFAVPAAGAGVHDSFFILGTAELTPGWVARQREANAVMGTFTSDRGGIVFQAATTDWVLNLLENPITERITANVLDRLQLLSVPVIGPLPAIEEPIGGRCFAAEGRDAAFHADVSGLPPAAERRFVWWVSDGTETTSSSPAVTVTVPSPIEPLTVCVTVVDDGTPVTFGTCTVLPLTTDEAARFEIAALIQELAMPADPGTSQFNPLENHAIRPPDVITTGLPWIRQRALRLMELAEQLMASRSNEAQWGRGYFEVPPFDDAKVADPRQPPDPRS